MRTIDDGRAVALRARLRSGHGIVTRDALAALGLGPQYGNRQVAAGRWQRAYDGTYVAHTGPLTFPQRCAVALAALGPDAVLDGATAATLHGLSGFEDERTYVVVPHGTSIRRPPGVVVTQSVVLTDRSRRDRAGLRAVRPEWAALAIARRSPWRARAVFAATVQQGFARADHLAACVLAVGRFRGRPLVAAALNDVAGGTRSELEGAFLDLCRARGLPLPERHVPVAAHGRRAWLDTCWPRERLVAEIDGKAFHVLGEDWEDDLARQNALVLAGLTVLRFSARDLRHDPGGVAAQVGQALDIARSRVAATA
jgi:hypothetical protein